MHLECCYTLADPPASDGPELNTQRQEELEEMRKEEAKTEGAGASSAETLTHAAAVDTFDTFKSSVAMQVEADKVFRPTSSSQPQWIFSVLFYFNFFFIFNFLLTVLWN